MFHESNESMSHESRVNRSDQRFFLKRSDICLPTQKSAKRKVSEIPVHLLRYAYFMPKGFSDV